MMAVTWMQRRRTTPQHTDKRCGESATDHARREDATAKNQSRGGERHRIARRSPHKRHAGDRWRAATQGHRESVHGAITTRREHCEQRRGNAMRETLRQRRRDRARHHERRSFQYDRGGVDPHAPEHVEERAKSRRDKRRIEQRGTRGKGEDDNRCNGASP